MTYLPSVDEKKRASKKIFFDTVNITDNKSIAMLSSIKLFY